MNHPEIALVVARARNGVIGKDGKLPWRIPADLRRFKQITLGNPMVMGRKTFESLPGLLEGRRHIVLTRDGDWQADGVEVAHSIDQALRMANAPHVSVIGGAEIYRLFLDRADRIELTEVDAMPDGDTVLDAFGAEWEEVARETRGAEGDIPGHAFVTLKRRG